MANKLGSGKKDVHERMKEIVIARIDAQIPSSLNLAIGNQGGISKDKMIEHVRRGDEIGQQIVNRHLQFMKSLASGEFTKALASVD